MFNDAVPLPLKPALAHSFRKPFPSIWGQVGLKLLGGLRRLLCLCLLQPSLQSGAEGRTGSRWTCGPSHPGSAAHSYSWRSTSGPLVQWPQGLGHTCPSVPRHVPNTAVRQGKQSTSFLEMVAKPGRALVVPGHPLLSRTDSKKEGD